MPASRIFPKSCYSCLFPHLWEKISFMPILGEVWKVLKVWLCSLADPFIWNISTLQEFWRETKFSDYSRYIMTRMYLVHSEPAVSSSPNSSFTREAGSNFSSSEGQADDSSILHLLQGQRENVSELMTSHTLTRPPLPIRRGSALPVVPKWAQEKAHKGESGEGGEKGQWLAMPSAWLAWGGWLKICRQPMWFGWLSQ